MFLSALNSARFVFAWTVVVLSLPSLVQSYTIGKRDAVLDNNLSVASWIWLPEPNLLTTAPTGSVALIKTFATPAGKAATSALITITVDNNFTLWVNGQPIGYNGDHGFQSAQEFSAQLNASANVFSVLGVNVASADTPGANNPAGLLASIRINYSDGSNETVLSDDTWLASGTIPADFPLPADFSQFVPAEVATIYGTGPWGQSVSISIPASNALDLTGSTWIWSSPDAAIDAPAGIVGFRKTLAAPAGKTAAWATVLLSVDNSFQLYVNKQFVGSPPFDSNAAGSAESWVFAQRFNVSLVPTANTFTVFAQNFPPQAGTSGTTSSAGFIAAIQTHYTDGTTDTVTTDATWLTGPFTSATAFLGAADSALVAATAQGAFGMAPWNKIGVADALNVLLILGNNAVVPPPSAAPLPAPTTTLPTSTPTNSPQAQNAPAGSGAHGGPTARIAPLFFVLVCFVVML